MLFPNFITSALTVVLGAVLVQAQELATGRYRIFNGDESARSFPIQGPGFESAITMSKGFASVWEQWDVSSTGIGSYLIQNVGTGAKVYAKQTLDAYVNIALNNQTTWSIENKGNNGQDNLYAVKIPFQDLVWTKTDGGDTSNIVLKGSDGSAEQRFVFQTVQ